MNEPTYFPKQWGNRGCCSLCFVGVTLAKIKTFNTLHQPTGVEISPRLHVFTAPLLRLGRWWIVGSSWSGRVLDQVTGVRHQSTQGEHSKLLEIARKQRMNTDVRKNIFCAVMSSEVRISVIATTRICW